MAELAEAQRRLQERLAHPGLSEAAAVQLACARQRLQAAAQRWAERKAESLEATREGLAELHRQTRAATQGPFVVAPLAALQT